jgi:hypothetical protein
MRAGNKDLKEWRLYLNVRFNIDDMGNVRLRIKPYGRSSKALAQIWPVEFWGGSGPAPYECKLLPGYPERYQEWLDKQREREAV